MKTRFFFFAVICALIFVGSCSKKSGEPAEEFPGDSISLETFMSVEPPTFDGFKTAYTKITTEQPETLTDQNKFLKELYLWVKRNPLGVAPSHPVEITTFGTGENETEMLGDESPVAQSAQRLTDEEWKLVFHEPIILVFGGIRARDMAYAAVHQNFPCDTGNEFDNSKGNAILHSYWNAMMYRHASPNFAKSFATAHESKSPPDAMNTKMDLNNNQFGRDFAAKNKDASDEELLNMLTRQPFVFVKEGEAFPTPGTSLVYFVGKRLYDGTMTGSFTNPDSGGPWQATLQVSQCGDTLRGTMTIVRGSEKQERRFDAQLDNQGSIKMTVSNPYSFENPRNLSYCRNIQITMKGNEQSMSGNWTSQNCSLGGVLNISR